ncbi:hypothetical protein ACHWQZ_G004809 [Mnemiopsis leidyi]
MVDKYGAGFSKEGGLDSFGTFPEMEEFMTDYVPDLIINVVSSLPQLTLFNAWPTTVIAHTFDNFQHFTGLPWYVTISALAILTKASTYPFHVWWRKDFQDHVKASPVQITTFLKTYFSNVIKVGSQEALKQAFLARADTCNNLNIPLYPNLFPIYVTTLAPISAVLGLSYLANLTYQPLLLGGALWFSNLAEPDPYHILPVLNSILIIANTRFHPFGLLLPTPVYGLKWAPPLLILTISQFWFSSAVLVYWISANFAGLIIQLLLRKPAVRELHGLQSKIQIFEPLLKHSSSLLSVGDQITATRVELSAIKKEELKLLEEMKSIKSDSSGYEKLSSMANYYQQGYSHAANYNYSTQSDSNYNSYGSYQSAAPCDYQSNMYNNYQAPGYQGQSGYNQNYNQNQYNYSQGYGYSYQTVNGYQYPQQPNSNVSMQESYGMPYNSNLPPPGTKRKMPEKEAKKGVNVTPQEAFPVSCGTFHKTEAEGYIPKRVPIPPEVMARMALAKSKLEANPRDVEAQSQLNVAMMEYHMYQNDRTSALQNEANDARQKTGYGGPGLFTGQALIEPMSKEEMDSDDIRTFARPDMFMNLKPLRENFGKSIMRKFGWREGKPLGTTGAGSLAPIEITVKIDRKGLKNEREFIKKKPEGLAKNEGPNWICKVVNTKNPVCGISEIHQALGLPTPVFKLVSEDNGVFKWNVSTNWGCFTPFKATKSKKQAKSECAYQALKEILRIESEHKGLEPPTEAEESCFLRCIFIPSNKTAAGNKMLYKHFYSGGQLTNILDTPGYLLVSEPLSATQPSEPTRASYDVVKPDGIGSTPTVPKHPILRAGADWMLDVINGKNASVALLDLCKAAKKPEPDEYSQYIGGSHVITISTPWGTFSHSEGRKSKREVRKMASYNAVKEILRNEAKKFNCRPHVELAESDENNLSFGVDTC